MWSDPTEQLPGPPGRVCHPCHSVPRKERWWSQPGPFWLLQTAQEPRELSLLHTLRRLESNEGDSLITVFNLSSVTNCRTHPSDNNFLLQAEKMFSQILSHFASTEDRFTEILNKCRIPEVTNLNHNTSAVPLSPMVVSSV